MPSRLACHALFALLALLPPSFAATARAQAWSWFAEPFSVRVATVHPQAGPVEGLVVVDAQAVRTEWSVAGMVQVSVALPEDEGARYRSLMPDGSVVEAVLTGADAYELLVQGYVAAVTPPEHPRHPCTASPDTRDGAVHGQLFWFDRAAGLVVRALDDSGADLRFSDHRRGPVDPGAFDLP